MPAPTPQQREYYVSVLPAPSALWTNKIAILPNQDQFWYDGTQWLPYGTGVSGGAGGVLNPGDPIIGLPAALDTLTEIAATVAGLSANSMARSVYDADGNGRVDGVDAQEFVFPVPVSVWSIPHGLGRKPILGLFDMANNGIDEPVRQEPSVNTTVLTWLVPQSGRAVIV